MVVADSSMHSTTISSGITKEDFSTPTRKPSMIARVSGRRMVKRLPTPSCELTSTVPRKAWMFLPTTSMPTPRPERLVTFSAVEKPASKIRLAISWSESV